MTLRVHRHEITAEADVVDENGHVNNVAYVRWMQDAATLHADSVGGTAATREAGATWVVRSHHVEYLLPAFEGDRIEEFTRTVHDVGGLCGYDQANANGILGITRRRRT